MQPLNQTPHLSTNERYWSPKQVYTPPTLVFLDTVVTAGKLALPFEAHGGGSSDHGTPFAGS